MWAHCFFSKTCAEQAPKGHREMLATPPSCASCSRGIPQDQDRFAGRTSCGCSPNPVICLTCWSRLTCGQRFVACGGPGNHIRDVEECDRLTPQLARHGWLNRCSRSPVVVAAIPLGSSEAQTAAAEAAAQAALLVGELAASEVPSDHVAYVVARGPPAGGGILLDFGKASKASPQARRVRPTARFLAEILHEYFIRPAVGALPRTRTTEQDKALNAAPLSALVRASLASGRTLDEVGAALVGLPAAAHADAARADASLPPLVRQSALRIRSHASG